MSQPPTEFLTFVHPTTGIRSPALPAGLFLFLTDTLESPATFLLTSFLSRALRDNRKTIFIGTSLPQDHYASLLKKTGIQLSTATAKGLFTFLTYSCGSDALPALTHELVTMLPSVPDTLIILEDVSALLWSGVPLPAILHFLHSLRAFVSSNGGSLVVLQHGDDLGSLDSDDAALFRRILQRADFWLETISLSSQVRGELSIHRGPALVEDYGVVEREGKSALQYKLEEAGAVFSVKGLGKEFL